MKKYFVMGDMRKGNVTQIDFEYGRGIIIDENGQDIHFQLDNVSDQININSKVIFEIELNKSGLVAVNVKLEMEEIKV
ncbi:cold shock CspA family protein [Pedobacter sp. AK013]|uniref:cold-shock protein n=1 Tax=Pedobacter sp. AK013 TaxID=2723071 RepID=UPI00160C5523|nr:cold-shock protein [Pedobacter sp. AK013]MBB6236471.1 cold shock CspA family protein [Pedobacter sp. AK013]